MKRQIVLTVALLLAVAGCTEDPLAALRGGAARVVLSSKVLSVNIADSTAVTATAVDDQGNPLPDQPAATSASPNILSIITASGAPLPQARFFVKGLAFGSGTVNVTVGGITDSIRVHAYPASVTITGTPDSVNSASSVVLTANPKSATSGDVTGVTPIDWESDDESIAATTTPGGTATVEGRTPGVATIMVSLPGGATAATPLRIVAAPFNGTLSAGSGDAGETVTVNRGAGSPVFDDDTEVLFGDRLGHVAGETIDPDQIQVAVPPGAAAGSVQLTVQGLGPNQYAQRTTFTMNSASLDDTYEATNNDPATAPAIVADGDYFVVLHGGCATGVATSGSDDCDDFFTITNASASPIDVTANFAWHEGNADVDILWCNAACDDFLGTFAGATGNNPEEDTITLAPGEVAHLWANLWDAGGEAYALVRVRVTGLP